MKNSTEKFIFSFGGKTKITSEEYKTLKEPIVEEENQSNVPQQEGFIEKKPFEDRLIVLTQTVNDGGNGNLKMEKIKVTIQDEDFLKRYQNQEKAILPRAVLKVIRKTDKKMEKRK